ncbi:MAG: histidine phosphatase family protein [Burkholderiales bacterium]|nr:histidine phosphatase family protein [Burkholderiales bacterium]
MSTTRFIVVRHGETAWNAQGRIQGHLDSPLNEEGLAQAILVGERLARERIDAVYCSDLGRVLQTVQPLLDRLGMEPVRDAALRERHLGVFQGLTGAECQARHPQDYARFHAREVDHAVPGGESIRQVYARVARFFDATARAHPDRTLAVFTHGGILDALYRHVTSTPLEKPRDFPVYNASLNWMRSERGHWLLEQWGDISHLTRDAALDDF